MTGRKPKRRPGFSMIEVLVAAAASCLLLTLAVPATQRARDRARLSSCQSRLSQIGIGLANYHDAHQMFPATYYAPYTAPGQREHWFGWQTSLLPHVGVEELYRDVIKSPTLPTVPDGFGKQSIGVYQCPADLESPRGVNELRGSMGKSNYSACVGGDPLPRWFAGLLQSNWPGAVANTEQLAKNFPGVMHANSNNGIKDCTDGTSTTILVVERGALSAAGIWMGVRSLHFDNDVATELSHLSPINRSLAGASSMHQGGVSVLFADGSVKFLNEDIESTSQGGVLQALAGRSDGRQLDASGF